MREKTNTPGVLHNNWFQQTSLAPATVQERREAMHERSIEFGK
jgi:hypothetical protein